MRIKTSIIFILSLFCANVFAQGGAYERGVYYYSVADCFRDSLYSGAFKPNNLALNRAFKGTRIWRTISLDITENKTLLNTGVKCSEIGLFEIIKFGLIEKKLKAFSGDNFDETAKTLYSEEEVGQRIKYKDSSVTASFDAEGKETKKMNVNVRYLMGSDVKSYLLKEDWVFNSQSGKTEKYIIGLAPLIYNEQEGRVLPLFWLYYPEWKGLLTAFRAHNLYSFEPMSFFDVFEKRNFISQINKESNIYDRSIKATNRGRDINLENELIKEKLMNSESDLFGH